MSKKIFLIRTYVSVGTVGPIPPLELLYTATQIQQTYPNYTLRITDMGIGTKVLKDMKNEIEQFLPDVIYLNAYVWEAKLVHDLTSLIKRINQKIVCVVIGQLATLAKKNLILDQNIDYVVVGEPEITSKEILEALENKINLKSIDGLIYREYSEIIQTSARVYPEDIDDISISSNTWDLINVKEYSQYANWNGALKEDFFIPILTSRGCPFPCRFCQEVYGKKFLSRTPENVVAEIKMLQKKYGVKEFHIYDSVFNYNNERAKKICQLIIDSKLNISLAFPHGIRADIMTEELIILLKKAGTYKLVYGIESASSRIQKIIRKNLNLDQVQKIITKTAKTGIIVGGYFMLGHESETQEEMEQTINYAVHSNLDIASFFKAMNYEDLIKIYKENKMGESIDSSLPYSFEDLGYYSIKRFHGKVPVEALNHMILKAQRKFYMNVKRVFRGVLKYPRKLVYMRNLLHAFGIIAQAYILEIFEKEFRNKSVTKTIQN